MAEDESKSSSKSSIQVQNDENNMNDSKEEEIFQSTPLPPIDKGMAAWIQVLGGFFLMFNCWGIILSFGTFETYYTTGGISDRSSRSDVAWIGSIQSFMLMFGGSLTGKLVDAGHYRLMVAVGSFLIVFGMMMTSLATKYYQFLLAQGFCVGLGMACFLIPSVAIPGTWFQKRRGLALGIVTTGSSVGAIIYPIMLYEIVPRLGIPWAARIFGFIALVTLLIPNLVLRQRLMPAKRKSLIDYRALKEPVFALYTVALFSTFLGMLVFYHFIVLWAEEVRLNMRGLPTFYLLPLLNAASCVGRIFPSYLSDYTGVLNVQVPGIAVSGVLVLAWIPAKSVGSVLTITLLYGFFSGIIAACPPIAVASLTEDMSTLGGRLGIVFGGMGIASLIGSPVSGKLVQAAHGNYDNARIYSGVVMLIGAVFGTIARLLKTKGKLIAKA